MEEELVRLKTVLEERERVYHKVAGEYEHYKRNPPATADGNIIALENNVQGLFGSVSDLMEGYKAYITALEHKVSAQK